jgi:hypothetical protein
MFSPPMIPDPLESWDVTPQEDTYRQSGDQAELAMPKPCAEKKQAGDGVAFGTPPKGDRFLRPSPKRPAR